MDRRRRRPMPAPWLAVTGTNGKTTTVGMLESILRAAGQDAVACGNVGLPRRHGGRRGARRARRGAVELPAALVAVGAARRGLRAERRRGPPGLARLDGRLRRGQGAGAARAGRGGGVDDPAAAALLAAAPAAEAGGRHARRARPRPARRRRGRARRPGVRRRGAGRRRRRHARRPVRAHRRAGRRRAGPRARRAARRGRGRAGGVPAGRRTAAPSSPRSTASRYVDDSKATNPHAADASLTAPAPRRWCGSRAVC